MNEDKITVKMNYCINPLMAQHVHIGGEFSIREGQTAEQAWALALERIDLFYREHFSQQNGPNSTPQTVSKDVVEPIDKIESWKTVISMCKSITALERFKPQVDREKNEGLTTAYNNKLKELQ